MKYLQCGFICMEDIPFQQLFMKRLIDMRQLILCPQDSAGHGLAAQRNTLAVQFPFLVVQRRTHDEF